MVLCLNDKECSFLKSIQCKTLSLFITIDLQSHYTFNQIEFADSTILCSHSNQLQLKLTIIVNNKRMHHQQQHQQQQKHPSLQSFSLVSLVSYLKTYRHKVKPPLQPAMGKQFCDYFDQEILKKTLGLLGEFVKMEKKRKKSDMREDVTRSQGCEIVQQDNTKSQIDKLILYAWQLANIRTITHTASSTHCNNAQSSPSPSFPASLTNQLHRLCITTSRIYISQWAHIRHVTLQAMQIAYFNLLKNGIIEPDPERNGSLCCVIQAILGDVGNGLIQDHDKFVNILKHDDNQQNQDELFDKKRKNMFTEQRNSQFYHHPSHTSPSFSQCISPPKYTIPDLTPHPPSSSSSSHHTHTPHSPSTPQQIQLQWLIYILQFCLEKNDQFVRNTYIQLSNGNVNFITHSAVDFLHFLALLFEKRIQDRAGTQFVKGYSCHIADVQQMYSKYSKINIKLSWNDYQWLIDVLLPEMLSKFKHELHKKYTQLLQPLTPESQSHPTTPTTHAMTSPNANFNVNKYNPLYLECLLTIISIMNSTLFLGGYSSILQKKVTKIVMDNVLQILELSYLVYEISWAKKRKIRVTENANQEKKEQGSNSKQQQSNQEQNGNKQIQIQDKKTTKQQQKRQQQKQIDEIFRQYLTNFQKLINYKGPSSPRSPQSQSEFQLTLIKIAPSPRILPNLHHQLPLQQSQLVHILRLLCNLVHINPEAQQYFQQNMQYFRIVLSLTHQCERQLTMKNWAIVFIKNVTEGSHKMREEMGRSGVQLKVDNGFEKLGISGGF